ncbi:MAG: hypothetical protein A2Z52_00840 [Candidatus Moranbacteria bacterium RBG_19FT_COMBO_42_6]|nr:MAG: hypothetical protein A2Z52_00840 [Candidatus Moranbacteria bacterium RBG_19FT_COMBO_42_6]
MGLDGLTEKDLTLVRKGGSADIKSPFRVLDIAKKLDIEIGFGSIFGFPWNTRSDLDSQSAHIHSVIDYGKEIGVTPLIMGGAFTPFPGSSLGRKVFGGELVGVKVVRQEPEFFDFHRPNIDTPNWSHQELENFLVKHFKSLMERG